jgi:ABC-type transport system involved in multi-copper enzyme maturation permease subunit
MSVRRAGVWVAYLIIFALMGHAMVQEGLDALYLGGTPWQEAGALVMMMNLFSPLIGGILAADRMQRDYRLGVRELQTSAPAERLTYILSKFVGVLLSAMLPLFLFLLLVSVLSVATGHIGPSLIGSVLVAFAAIAVPSFAFVIAFSLACPLVMPLRVYQILFTGYWFWGNFFNDEVFPTISGTILNASGMYAQEAFFGSPVAHTAGRPMHTAPEAWLNILVLVASVAAVMFALERYLAWQGARA